MLTESIIRDHEPLYLLSDVAAAAGIPVNTVRRWFDRGQVSYAEERDRIGGGRGVARHLSMSTALHLACMKVLIDLGGMGPSEANRAAFRWVHIGEPQRAPAGLYKQVDDRHPDNYTMLCAWPDGTARVQLVPLAGGRSPVELLLHSDGGRRPGVLLVCLNDIDRHVRSYLRGRERAGNG